MNTMKINQLCQILDDNGVQFTVASDYSYVEICDSDIKIKVDKERDVYIFKGLIRDHHDENLCIEFKFTIDEDRIESLFLGDRK